MFTGTAIKLYTQGEFAIRHTLPWRWLVVLAEEMNVRRVHLEVIL